MSSPDSTALGDAAGLNPDTPMSLREGGSFDQTQTMYVKRVSDGHTFRFGMCFASGRVDDIFFLLGQQARSEPTKLLFRGKRLANGDREFLRDLPFRLCKEVTLIWKNPPAGS